jgi:hypothetical protein
MIRYRPLPVKRPTTPTRVTLDHVPVPSWIIPLDSRDTAGKKCMLHINDIQAVLGHFFHGMRSHIVPTEPNLFSDPFYP